MPNLIKLIVVVLSLQLYAGAYLRGRILEFSY